MINNYDKHPPTSEARFKHIIHLFVEDLPASKIAELSRVILVSINNLLLKIRCRLAHFCA